MYLSFLIITDLFFLLFYAKIQEEGNAGFFPVLAMHRYLTDYLTDVPM